MGKYFRKPNMSEKQRVPPGQHLANRFPVLTYGETPHITPQDWQLKVWGLVKEQTFVWSDILALPQSNFTADFHCVTHWSKLDVSWAGFAVSEFMQLIELQPGVTHVMQHCYGGYITNLTLDDFLHEQTFFAHTLDGQPLPADHGGPLRLVVPHLYAWKSGKWLNGLEFLDYEQLGFWEANGYHRRGEPWAEERYSSR
ncbi:sulfite oxidase-like oxidoreductase [Acaryochloris marina]|uniref:sulfite oxidase-like oxidoreductase n=1 Tax=Acaryochloris marina TaxID=155978 RepID=UPI0021C43C37|nr:sulfite oxidase-like oxidoreductase [Acaryochloris marina]BDM82653.1 sulfite oxidase-like oxidoreductase [Acaryochloris marina MBIC10699]